MKVLDRKIVTIVVAAMITHGFIKAGDQQKQQMNRNIARFISKVTDTITSAKTTIGNVFGDNLLNLPCGAFINLVLFGRELQNVEIKKTEKEKGAHIKIATVTCSYSIENSKIEWVKKIDGSNENNEASQEVKDLAATKTVYDLQVLLLKEFLNAVKGLKNKVNRMKNEKSKEEVIKFISLKDEEFFKPREKPGEKAKDNVIVEAKDKIMGALANITDLITALQEEKIAIDKVKKEASQKQKQEEEKKVEKNKKKQVGKKKITKNRKHQLKKNVNKKAKNTIPVKSMEPEPGPAAGQWPNLPKIIVKLLICEKEFETKKYDLTAENINEIKRAIDALIKGLELIIKNCVFQVGNDGEWKSFNDILSVDSIKTLIDNDNICYIKVGQKSKDGENRSFSELIINVKGCCNSTKRMKIGENNTVKEILDTIDLDSKIREMFKD